MRLVVHIRNLRKVARSSDGSSGLHTTAVTVVMMLIESYALYAVTLLLYVVPWAVESPTSSLFSEAIVVVRVRAGCTFPQCPVTLGNCRLITVIHRSSLHT